MIRVTTVMDHRSDNEGSAIPGPETPGPSFDGQPFGAPAGDPLVRLVRVHIVRTLLLFAHCWRGTGPIARHNIVQEASTRLALPRRPEDHAVARVAVDLVRPWSTRVFMSANRLGWWPWIRNELEGMPSPRAGPDSEIDSLLGVHSELTALGIS